VDSPAATLPQSRPPDGRRGLAAAAPRSRAHCHPGHDLRPV